MKIIKNYLYNVFYQLFIIIAPLITMPYISRVLGPTDVGINSYTNSIVQYFILFGGLGVALYGNRQIAYVRDDRQRLTNTFWEITFMRVATMSISLLAFYAFLYFEHQYRQAYLMQSLLIWASLLDISWFFQGMENFRVTVLRNTLVKLGTIILLFVCIKGPQDLIKYILILSLSQVLGNLTLWPYLRNYIDYPHFKQLRLWQHLGPSIALFIPQIATQLYLILNKQILRFVVDVQASGFYDDSDKIVKMLLAIVTATGTVMLPHVANSFAKGDRKSVRHFLYQMFDFVSCLAMPLMFGIASIALQFAPWFFSNKFAAVGPLMMIESMVVLLIAWSNAIGVQYLLPMHRNRDYTLSVTLGAILNIIISVPLIIWLGINGSMVATVLSELVVTGYQLWVIRHEIVFGKLFQNVGKYFIAGMVMFIVIFGMNLKLVFNWKLLIIEIMLGILIYGGLLLILRPTILNVLTRSLIHFKDKN